MTGEAHYYEHPNEMDVSDKFTATSTLLLECALAWLLFYYMIILPLNLIPMNKLALVIKIYCTYSQPPYDIQTRQFFLACLLSLNMTTECCSRVCQSSRISGSTRTCTCLSGSPKTSHGSLLAWCFGSSALSQPSLSLQTSSIYPPPPRAWRTVPWRLYILLWFLSGLLETQCGP